MRCTFEAEGYVGGHTHTVDVKVDGETYAADTGFMVFNDRTYPNFIRMLDLLGVPSRDSDMSFSVRCDRTGLEVPRWHAARLVCPARNLFRPSFYRMLRDILRFNRKCRTCSVAKTTCRRWTTTSQNTATVPSLRSTTWLPWVPRSGRLLRASFASFPPVTRLDFSAIMGCFK